MNPSKIHTMTRDSQFFSLELRFCQSLFRTRDALFYSQLSPLYSLAEGAVSGDDVAQGAGIFQDRRQFAAAFHFAGRTSDAAQAAANRTQNIQRCRDI